VALIEKVHRGGTSLTSGMIVRSVVFRRDVAAKPFCIVRIA
jgi:hypothetical protein